MPSSKENGPEMVGGLRLQQSCRGPVCAGGQTQPAVDFGPAINIKIKKN
jgi:hypothetical protein